MLDASSFPLVMAFGIVGLIVGSFIGAATIRLPRGETIVTGRSRCDACGKTLSARELVPVLSYLLQRRRCRHCHAPIVIDQPIAELGCLAVAIFVLLSAASLGGALSLALFGCSLVALALLDARHFWLPDRITLPLMMLGLLAVLVMPEITLEQRLLGVLVGYGALELLRLTYRRLRGRDGLGAGDAKLLGAIGAWLGVETLPYIVLAAALLGLAYAGVRTLIQPVDSCERLPLGTFLSIAALAAMPAVYG